MNFRFQYVFAKHYGLRAIKRLFTYVLVSLIMPISFLFIFSMIAPGYIRLAILGGLLTVSVSSALVILFDAAHLRLQQKVQDLFLATKLKPLDYMLGLTLSELIYGIPSILLYIGIGFAYHIYSLSIIFFITVGIAFLLYFAIASLGFVLSLFPKYLRATWSYSGILTAAMTIFAPLYYPYILLPKPLLYLFLILPSASASVLVQGMYGVAPYFQPAAAIFIAEVIICVIIALALIQKRSE